MTREEFRAEIRDFVAQVETRQDRMEASFDRMDGRLAPLADSGTIWKAMLTAAFLTWFTGVVTILSVVALIKH